MGNEFQSPRWHGRLMGLVIKIARKRGVYFYEGQEVTFFDLFIAVAKKASDEEMDVINSLMKKASDLAKEEEAQGTSISQEEHDRLHDIGMQEAFAICNRGLPIDDLATDKDIMAEEKVRRMDDEKKRAEEEKIRAEKNRKSVITVCSIMGAIILTLIIYNLPYFKELRFYNEVVESGDTYKINKYYRIYPHGRHYEDVMAYELQLSEKGKGEKPIHVLTRYLHKFPDGKYSQKFNAQCDSLWDNEIAKYQQRDKSHESPDAVKYMTEMLHYMKTKRVNSVNFKINPSVTLKDYDEYSEDAKLILRLFSRANNVEFDQEKILSLKENFTQQDKSILVQILAEGLEKSFRRMFSSDFVAINKDKDDYDSLSPNLTINYTIKNQELATDKYIIPDVWTYRSQDFLTKQWVTKGFILGIDVNFDTQFTIPGSDVTYNYTEVGEPGKEIRDIESIQDGYRQMTQMCFAKFSNKMSDNLGLEETYFRGDDDEDEDD